MSERDYSTLVPLQTTPECIEKATPEQRERLVELARRYGTPELVQEGRAMSRMRAFLGTGGLPSTWLYIVIEFAGGGQLHGGISPEGSFST